jgi:hypothetical protein
MRPRRSDPRVAHEVCLALQRRNPTDREAAMQFQDYPRSEVQPMEVAVGQRSAPA